ncbi:MAG: GNAT family N-acetyltransferase [Clostridia bacterium]|nr:GNAT family N-acetyltransferase [Clostridia bacterium]
MNIELDLPNQSDRKALRDLWKEAFGDTEEFLDLFERTAYSPDRCRQLTLDGRLAAALYWFDCEYQGAKIAYLYAIATAKEQRGMGLCRQLMENTHEHLRALGYAAALLVPSEPSLFGFYEKLGYKTATKVTEFSCAAADESIELLRIEKEEYAKLRRKILPSGGVIQEKENMTYLAAQAELYRGEQILLAARKENETLVGIELLGDMNVAPKIVKALGAKKGTFRTVGNDRKLSMIYQLNEQTTPTVTYFGIPFD